MLSVNPFAVAAASLPAGFLQWFLVVMVLAVVAGTLFDIVHKGSARYFFTNMGKSKGRGRELGGGELASIAVKTAVVDVLASGEHDRFDAELDPAVQPAGHLLRRDFSARPVLPDVAHRAAAVAAAERP